MASFSFAGTTSSKLIVPYSPDLDFGSGDFTVEWLQYSISTPENQCPTAFSRGDWFMSAATEPPSSFIYWYNNYGTHQLYPLEKTTGWIHYAITRAKGTTRLFMNGKVQLSFADATDYTNIRLDLVIGNENVPAETAEASFNGYMTYFAWNKGYARYTDNFTVSNTYPPILPSTVLMLSAYGNRGTLGATVQNSNVELKPISAPNFMPINAPQLKRRAPFSRMLQTFAR